MVLKCVRGAWPGHDRLQRGPRRLPARPAASRRRSAPQGGAVGAGSASAPPMAAMLRPPARLQQRRGDQGHRSTTRQRQAAPRRAWLPRRPAAAACTGRPPAPRSRPRCPQDPDLPLQRPQDLPWQGCAVHPRRWPGVLRGGAAPEQPRPPGATAACREAPRSAAQPQCSAPAAPCVELRRAEWSPEAAASQHTALPPLEPAAARPGVAPAEHPLPLPPSRPLQQFLFLKQKCRSLFNQRKRPAKLAWTTLYRKQHRKVRARLGWGGNQLNLGGL